jgi:glycosidase
VGAHPDGLVAPGPGATGPGTPSQWVLGYQAWWDLPALPKLNHSNPAVRDYIFGVAERWTRFGIDGWRLDVPEDIDEPGFWEEFRRRILAINPEAYLVGEIWTPARDWLTDRFDALMNYPLAESILSFVGAGRLDHELVARTHEYGRHVRDIDGPEFGRQLAEVMATFPPEIASLQLNLLDSHDTPRFLSLAGGDATALRLAVLIQMTLPGAPCIYYGDEVGLEGRHDPDCRRAYPWDPARQDRALRDFYAGVVAMRHAHPVLRRGRFELLAAEGSAVAYRLFDPETSAGGSDEAGPVASVVVALNAGSEPVQLTIERPGPAGHRLEQVSWPGRDWRTTFAPRLIDGGPLVMEVEPREGVAIQAISIL